MPKASTSTLLYIVYLFFLASSEPVLILDLLLNGLLFMTQGASLGLTVSSTCFYLIGFGINIYYYPLCLS